MDERRSSIEVKRPRDEKRVETLPGECPIRTAILYKDNKELCHWLSNEQQQHMKRIDVIHRNEIEAVLRGIKDATTPQHIVKQGYDLVFVFPGLNLSHRLSTADSLFLSFVLSFNDLVGLSNPFQMIMLPS